MDYVPSSGPVAGSAVRTVAAGVVAEVVSKDSGGYGISVRVTHADGYESLYGHLEIDSPTVVRGQQVSASEVIGRLGTTGTSTAPHLHVRIHLNGTRTDPAPLIDQATLASLTPVPAAPPAPAPQLVYDEEDEMYARRSNQEIAVFGASYRTTLGGGTGRHIFSSVDEYNIWRSLVISHNSTVDAASKKPVPPLINQVMNVDDLGWGVLNAIYGT